MTKNEPNVVDISFMVQAQEFANRSMEKYHNNLHFCLEDNADGEYTLTLTKDSKPYLVFKDTPYALGMLMHGMEIGLLL